MCKMGAARGTKEGKKSAARGRERGREEEGTVWYRGRREVECMGHRVQHSWLHAFRMATGFTVPSQGRRGTAPLNQLCHFYARRLIFVQFYYLQCVCLLPRACALCAYVDARLLLGGCNAWCVLCIFLKSARQPEQEGSGERITEKDVIDVQTCCIILAEISNIFRIVTRQPYYFY